MKMCNDERTCLNCVNKTPDNTKISTKCNTCTTKLLNHSVHTNCNICYSFSKYYKECMYSVQRKYH